MQLGWGCDMERKSGDWQAGESLGLVIGHREQPALVVGRVLAV